MMLLGSIGMNMMNLLHAFGSNMDSQKQNRSDMQYFSLRKTRVCRSMLARAVLSFCTYRYGTEALIGLKLGASALAVNWQNGWAI